MVGGAPASTFVLLNNTVTVTEAVGPGTFTGRPPSFSVIAQDNCPGNRFLDLVTTGWMLI